MKLLETNSALGYNQVAYFIEHMPWYTQEYFCIYSDNEEIWVAGKNYSEEGVEYTKFDEVIKQKYKMVLDSSPMRDNYLFEEFIKELK